MKIIAFYGAKQSGKDSAAKFLLGYKLKQQGRLKKFFITEKGELVVNTAIFLNPDSDEYTENLGVLDTNRKDDMFVSWAWSNIWPYVKTYAFADPLKQIAMSVFGLDYKQVYGSDEDKNTLTNITWKDMATFLPPRTVSNLKKLGLYELNMTAREFLQYFGTDICRKLYSNCWVNNIIAQIVLDDPELALITDLRFQNEFKAIKDINGKVIKLTRRNSDDTHISELDMSDVKDEDFDLVIDNQNMTIDEKNQILLDNVFSWGYLPDVSESNLEYATNVNE